MTPATTPTPTPAPFKVIQTPVFLYADLSGAAKEAAREWLKEGAFYSDWYEPTYEDAKTVLAKFGFFNPEIQYSGFYSQGDGASFTARWERDNVSKSLPNAIKRYAPKDEELNALAVRFAAWLAKWPTACNSSIGRVDHQHSHEYSVAVYQVDDDTDDILPDDCEKEFSEIARELMKWIYAQLKTEAENIESEKSLAELAEANEYTFTATGERFG